MPPDIDLQLYLAVDTQESYQLFVLFLQTILVSKMGEKPKLLITFGSKDNFQWSSWVWATGEGSTGQEKSRKKL